MWKKKRPAGVVVSIASWICPAAAFQRVAAALAAQVVVAATAGEPVRAPIADQDVDVRRADAARTVQALWDAIRDAIDAVTPQDAAGFFTACGYEPE